jgi:hypothetical protein
MSRPIAIVNGSIITAEGELPSGVILIERGVITVVGPPEDVATPADAQLIDAERGVLSAGAPEVGGYPLIAGRAANLVCHTRFGEMAWAMQGGVVVLPSEARSRPAPVTWEAHRARAVAQVLAFLQERPETRHIQLTDALPGYQGRGIDILWRFHAEEGGVQSLSIRVVPSLDDEPARIFVLDGPSARKLPAAGLSQTKAHWWFYHHGPDAALYCIPVAALKRWMDRHAKGIPPTRVRVAGVAQPLSGRAIPVARLQEDIERIRVVNLS